MKNYLTQIVLATSLTISFTSFSETPVPSQPKTNGDWRFTITPYALAANIVGDAGVGRVGAAPLNVDTSDILETLEMAAMLHTEIAKGPWGVAFDLTYMKLGSDITGPTGGVSNIEVEEFVAETFLTHRFDFSSTSLDLYAGGRFWDIDNPVISLSPKKCGASNGK